ncbi:RNA-binding cell elongation regulator Jag/EloR [Vagococcus elongatus]|uniref:RNA-binding protein KhpB n=1 Tax=Vagococcus elongatus TaxID=180344 RepID=A0A430AUX5_9ENTE|nr:RNA-binding cell elongation regulator Jag/EloR [Vagococcus elongatus]RSU11864.1 RNA-binding protein [Vagococcus elongatus]
MSQFKGATVAQAIETGLKSLGLTRESVDIKIIEEEKKGFLGFGKKEALVELTPVEQPADTKEKKTKEDVKSGDETASEKVTDKGTYTKVLENLSEDQTITELALYLTDVTRELGAPAMVKVAREKELIVFHLESKKAGMLIGKHGRVLNAMQYLSQVFVHRVSKERLSVVVNVGDYRERRQATMEKLAIKTARRVEETGRPVSLEPMPAFERKIIHGILTDHPYVKTHSEGEEPYRYLVVEPQKDVF